MSNIFPIDFEEKLTMAQDDYILFSDSEDGNKIKKAQYKNLKGEPGTPGTPGKDGEDGAAATITVGSTTTGAAGSSASVTNSGTSSAAILDFTIPQGAKGEPGEDGQDGADGAAATITVGTTTTLPAGSSATVTNVGTSQDAILNFGIPKGDDGTGSGDVNGPASSTDGDVALFDGATGKLIKDSGVSLADYQEKLTAGTNIQIQNNVISATGGSEIVYATQAEYNALLPGALTDGKHYFIYSTSGGGGWQPGVNTIAYYPLNSTYTDTDQSGNNNNGTTTGTIIYDSISAQFSSGNYITIPTIIPYGSNPYTISVWYNTPDSSGHQNVVYFQVNSNIDNTASALFVYQGHLYYWSKGASDWNISSVSISNDTWYNIVFTYTGTQLECFVNSVSKGTFNRTISSAAPNTAYIGKGSPEICIGKTSNLIIENKVRTSQEISDYYDQTKSLYGIS